MPSLPPAVRRALPGYLGLLLLLGPPARAAATPAALGPLDGLRRFTATLVPEPTERSLLADARRGGLDWAAVQKLFAVRVTDEANGFLEWRGHQPPPTGAGGPVFTVVRAATYRQANRALLVLTREWCSRGACEARTVFAWQPPQGPLVPAAETSLIPLIRDAAFWESGATGPVPPCLRGVTLGVQYLPARRGPALHVLAVVPPAAQRACAGTGVNLLTALRPLTLTWNAGAGKFRW